MDAQEFWNAKHLERPVKPLDDSCLRALAYFGDVRGKTLLDLGCGTGENSIFFAQQGARVTAIDLSPAAIDGLNKLKGDLDIRPVVCDAMDIASLGSFDFVYGRMILHHIEPFDQFAVALAKCLSGKAWFYENSANSRMLIWCRTHLAGRFWIPKMGDDDEFPLMPHEIDLLRAHFDVKTRYPEMFFLQLASVYLLRGRFLKTTKLLDGLLHKIKPFRRFSYYQDVEIQRNASPG